MRHTTRVAPKIPASILHAGAFADTHILFDWHKIEGIKGSTITGIQTIIRGTDGADQVLGTTVGMDLFFATSQLPTPDDVFAYDNSKGPNVNIDAAPGSLGNPRAAVNGTHFYNNLVGYVPIVGTAAMSDGDLVVLNMASNSGLSIPIGRSDLYIAAISKGAYDFRTTAQVNETAFTSGTQETITVDTGAARIRFAPGDIVHAADDAVLGTIKAVNSDTEIVLTKPNIDDIANNDVLYDVTPISFVISSED